MKIKWDFNPGQLLLSTGIGIVLGLLGGCALVHQHYPQIRKETETTFWLDAQRKNLATHTRHGWKWND